MSAPRSHVHAPDVVAVLGDLYDRHARLSNDAVARALGVSRATVDAVLTREVGMDLATFRRSFLTNLTDRAVPILDDDAMATIPVLVPQPVASLLRRRAAGEHTSVANLSGRLLTELLGHGEPAA